MSSDSAFENSINEDEDDHEFSEGAVGSDEAEDVSSSGDDDWDENYSTRQPRSRKRKTRGDRAPPARKKSKTAAVVAAVPAKKTKKPVVSERALALIPYAEEPSMTNKEMLAHVRAAYENGRYKAACAMLRETFEEHQTATALTRIFSVLYALCKHAIHGTPVRGVWHEICITSRLLFDHFVRLPRKARGVLCADAIKLVLLFTDIEAMWSPMVRALVASRKQVLQWNSAVKQWSATENNVKFLLGMLVRTAVQFKFSFRVNVARANMSQMAALMARALDRAALVHTNKRQFNSEFITALFAIWPDHRVNQFMMYTQLPGVLSPGDGSQQRHYVQFYMTDQVWARMCNHRYYSMALPLVQSDILALYPIVWILEWLFPSIPPIQAVRRVERVLKSYWKVKAARASAHVELE